MDTKAASSSETLTFAKALAKSQTQNPPESNSSKTEPNISAAADSPSTVESTKITNQQPVSSDSNKPSENQIDSLASDSKALSTADSSKNISSLDSHPLQYKWTFWFMHRYPGQKIVDYEAAISKISTFYSIEEFWNVYSYICRPNDMPTVSDFHLFKHGVRPVWEDELNIEGGKWMIRIKKGLSSRLWERLVFAIIGNQFDAGDEVCGAVLSIRNSEDIISLWNKTANDAAINISIRDTIKSVLEIPVETVMEYKAHNDSLRDNSSFRNTEVYK
ncbi:Eukaryotic translation initiation factor 4E type 2 [Smittium culicis]|uniref:Eukaryotic translation initiation factor 4E type 2 n=1 Tax=Smittium culicis TaxID=133412 RepID=A0A1R1YFH7_9FUNG|nr:Eukaryotic translation initiation factor 4E type 2 [Smittium culicis]